MGNSGRFSKYGEIKRLNRLHNSRISVPLVGGDNRANVSRINRPTLKVLPREPRLIVRPARGNEGLFIKQLSRKVFRIYGPYEEIIPKWFGADITTTVIAIMEGQLVGFAMIGNPSKINELHHVAELLAIGVDPIRQGRGIGTFLLREVERKAVALGIKRIFLHTAKGNYYALKLFSRSGYIKCEVKRSFYPEGQDAFVMSKVPI